ncbi:MAG TPA: hypothetical protein VFG19_13420 [Geobacteraceae bacterium]|nr:hypothetical protein [Geobacteraceae bacterium]
MYQEEILKAIREQTRAIERLIEAVEKQTQSLEWLALNFQQVLETGREKETPEIADMTDDEFEEYNKRLLAELDAAQRAKRK